MRRKVSKSENNCDAEGHAKKVFTLTSELGKKPANFATGEIDEGHYFSRG